MTSTSTTAAKTGTGWTDADRQRARDAYEAGLPADQIDCAVAAAEASMTPAEFVESMTAGANASEATLTAESRLRDRLAHCS